MQKQLRQYLLQVITYPTRQIGAKLYQHHKLVPLTDDRFRLNQPEQLYQSHILKNPIIFI